MLNARALLPSEVFELIETHGDVSDGETATLTRPLTNDPNQVIMVTAETPYVGEAMTVVVRVRHMGEDAFGTRVVLAPGDKHCFLVIDEYGCGHLRIGPFSIHLENHLDNTILHETLVTESLFY